MVYNTTAVISTENIANNVALIREKIKPETKMMVAVKSNAYGHGMIEFSQCLYDLGIRYFAVACLDAAVEMRTHFPDCEILVLGFTHPTMAGAIAENNIIQAVYGLEYAQKLSECCENQGVSVRSHLAFDTGMSRIGFQDAKEAIEASMLGGIKVCGAFTHFSCADMPERDDFTKGQYNKFTSLVGEVKAAGVNLEICHCANSAAIFRFPEFQLDMVRAGIVIYGLLPNPKDPEPYIGIKPVMQLKSFISHVKWLDAGQGVGYGATFVTPDKMRIATVSCGYGDGFVIPYSKGYVLVKGKRAKIVGRICMDQFMIDVTDIPEAEILSEVTLLGEDGSERVSADMLAEFTNGINYQVVTSITDRVKRIYR